MNKIEHVNKDLLKKSSNVKMRLSAFGAAVLMTVSFAGCSESNEVTPEVTTTTATITTMPNPELEEIIMTTVTEKQTEETKVEKIDSNECDCCTCANEKVEETTVIPTEAPVVTEVSTTTTKEVTTEVPVTTTAQTTTEAPVTTTAQTTTVSTTEAPSVSYEEQEINLKLFEQYAEALAEEYKRNNIYKTATERYTKEDMYSTVYLINIDSINKNEELRQILIDKNYISDNFEAIAADSFDVEGARSTHNLTRLKWNTNMDELVFGLEYFKDDPTVYFELIDEESVSIGYHSNSQNKINTNVTDKLSRIDLDEYYEARNKFYKKHDINKSVIEFYIENCENKNLKKLYKKVYKKEDLVNLSVAVHNPNDRAYIEKSLDYVVAASLDNTGAYEILKNYYFYAIGKNNSTSFAPTVGGSYALNLDCFDLLKSMSANKKLDEYADQSYVPANEYKSLRGFTADEKEYKQALTMSDELAEFISNMNNISNVHKNGCKQYTK